jgi:hypothetical protein
MQGSTPQFDRNKVLIPFYAWLPHEEEEDEDMKPLWMLVGGVKYNEPEIPGEFYWYPGINPTPFASPEDRDQMLLGWGVSTQINISVEQYNRLFIPPVEVHIPEIPAPVITFPAPVSYDLTPKK